MQQSWHTWNRWMTHKYQIFDTPSTLRIIQFPMYLDQELFEIFTSLARLMHAKLWYWILESPTNLSRGYLKSSNFHDDRWSIIMILISIPLYNKVIHMHIGQLTFQLHYFILPQSQLVNLLLWKYVIFLAYLNCHERYGTG